MTTLLCQKTANVTVIKGDDSGVVTEYLSPLHLTAIRMKIS